MAGEKRKLCTPLCAVVDTAPARLVIRSGGTLTGGGAADDPPQPIDACKPEPHARNGCTRTQHNVEV